MGCLPCLSSDDASLFGFAQLDRVLIHNVCHGAVAEVLTVTTLAQPAQHARARVIAPVAMVGAPAPLANELSLLTSKVKAVQASSSVLI